MDANEDKQTELAGGIAGKPVPAGFWVRAGAYLLDNCIITAVTLTFVVAWPALLERLQFGPLNVVQDFGFVAYYLVFFSLWSTTPAKRLYGLKVIDRRTGGRIRWHMALVRALMYYVSSIMLGFGYWMALMNREKLALHDFVAGTQVVVEKKRKLLWLAIITVLSTMAMLFAVGYIYVSTLYKR